MAAGGKGSPARFRIDGRTGDYENLGEDPLQPREHAVMDLWDAGLTREDIALRTGLALATVRNITDYLDDRPDVDEGKRLQAQRDACAELAARIRQFFPHIALAPIANPKA
ncbi:hypothetical protein [Sphingopyxis granuli]|uniref:hypothetical protein n=1 Tax=Sphingopyxis granuli TaxID=267128 RepID=UPI001BAFD4EA|nr:hypothetical protein [Sphingopyxis granuli]QUM73325.1 hypothetical protein ICN83_05415 [Sphingopyxis granuli]